MRGHRQLRSTRTDRRRFVLGLGILVVGTAAVLSTTAMMTGVRAAPGIDQKAVSSAYYANLKAQGIQHLHSKDADGAAPLADLAANSPIPPADAVPAGNGFIEATNPGPPGDSTFVLANAWVDFSDTPMIDVWAGSSTTDPTIGRISLVKYNADGQLVSQQDWFRAGSGALRIISVDTTTLSIAAANGAVFTLDATGVTLSGN